MSERYPTWFLIALAALIVVLRFVVNGWGVWIAGSALFIFLGVVFSSVVNESWVRDSIRSGVETSTKDATVWPDIVHRRFTWARNVTLMAALFIMVVAIAFDAFAGPARLGWH